MVFASGYFLAHDTVIDVPVLGRQMFLIHILSGEAMLVLTAFLFVATRLDGKKCTGCAACAIQCPTGTLASHDGAGLRVFTYSHFRCIACGSCVDACPEYAAGLRHEINPLRLFQVARAREIRAVELTACRMCGAWFTPEPQLEKIREALHDAYVSLCPGCRKIGYASTFRRLAPWTRKIRSMHDGSKVGEGAL
jgi:Pyruvate/2-oxoacid:ferredoxin oxidoreductase delta subunit